MAVKTRLRRRRSPADAGPRYGAAVWPGCAGTHFQQRIGHSHGWRMCYSCSRRRSPPLDSTPKAYRLKVPNAAPPFFTIDRDNPGEPG